MTKSSWKSVFACLGSADVEDSSAAPESRKPQSDSDSPKRLSSSSDNSNSPARLSSEDLSLTLAGSNLHAFTVAELKAVTRNFSNSNFIGSGGFGPVFKGYIDEKLRPGLKAQHVAVKSLDLEGTQGHKEWMAEVIFLGQLRHPHLAKLIGYCCEDEHRLLVYEYMARGSLEQHLFKRLLAALPWSTRLKIAVGAAKGLAFLHESEKPVIYRDFKASNILLDADYNAKLSDFGLAKDGPQGDDTHVTTRVMGTHGYAAPEYILTGHLTAKSDVYSFGVVLLELLSGRRSVDKTRPNREKNLVEWARPYLNNPDRLFIRVVDPNLDGHYSAKGAQKAAAVAYKCLSTNPKSRPNMRTVVETLEPLLELKDVALGSFVFVPAVDKCGEDAQDMKKAEVVKVVDVVSDAKEKEPHGHEHHHHHNHDLRHKKRFPNSAIHSEFIMHRDGSSLYRNSLMHLKSSQKQNQEHGA